MKELFRTIQRNTKMNRKGMTLIEVLVAVMVLSMFSIGIITSIKTSASVSDSADVIVHFQEVKNNTMEKFQANPSQSNLSLILPINHQKIDDNNYVLYYDEHLKTVTDPLESAYKMTFRRSAFEELDGFQLNARETTLEINIYQRDPKEDALVEEDIDWKKYQPTLDEGTSGVGVLHLGGTPGIPGGEDITIGVVNLEVINGTIEYEGNPVGGRYQLIGVIPGSMLTNYLDKVSFIPAAGMNKVPTYEIRSELTESGWLSIPDLNVPIGFETTIRITYVEQTNINLKFNLPGYLNPTDRTIEGVVNTEHDLAGAEINLNTLARLLGASSYEALFAEVNGYDYKDIIWKDPVNGTIITYEELEEGISLYTKESVENGRPVVDVDKYANRMFVAEQEGLGNGGHTLYIRVIGYDRHPNIPDGQTYYVVPGVGHGEVVSVGEIAKTIFGEDTSITDYRSVTNSQASIIQHSSGFGSGSTGNISFQQEINRNNGIKMTKTEYVTITYRYYTVDLPLFYSLDGGLAIGITRWKTRTDVDNIATVERLSGVIGSNILTLFGPTYKLEGAFILGRNRLNQPVWGSDGNYGMILRYASLPNPLYLNVQVDGSKFGEESLTDATVVNLSFQTKATATGTPGMQLKVEQIPRTIQVTPEVKTTGKTHMLDFQYSLNDEKYRSPGTVNEFNNAINEELARGNYSDIIIRFYATYDYVDVKGAIDNGAELRTVTGIPITDETINNIFQKQGATFRPFEGVNTDRDLKGRITYYGPGADANLREVLTLDEALDIKFQSYTTASVAEDIEIGEYTENITLVWDISGMESVAKTAEQAVQMGGSIGLIPVGNDNYRLSYQQNGQELMTSNNIINVPNIKTLRKLTLVIHRVEQLTEAYNYYGAWRPLINAHGAVETITNGEAGKDWYNIYNIKDTYETPQLSPGSIPIYDVEVVYGTGTSISTTNDTVYAPDSVISHEKIVDKRVEPRILSDRQDKLVFGKSDVPSGRIQYQTERNYTRYGFETGFLLGERNEEEYKVKTVPFDYSDLTTEYISNVTLTGGLSFGVK